MKIKNWIVFSLIAMSMAPLSTFAADNLVIWNDTNSDATFKINQGDCSASILGKDGLVKSQNWSSVDIGAVTSLCGESATSCVVDIYMTGDCSGPIVGTATMDTTKGISAVDSKKVNGVFVSKKQDGRLFSISIIGGPALSSPTNGATSTTNTTPSSTTDVTGDVDTTVTITKPEPIKVVPSAVMSPLNTPDEP